MKRTLLALILALAIHALFFWIHIDLAPDRHPDNFKSSSVSISLVHTRRVSQEPKPVPEKKLIRKPDPVKKVPKPVKKVRKPNPVKKVHKPVRPLERNPVQTEKTNDLIEKPSPTENKILDEDREFSTEPGGLESKDEDKKIPPIDFPFTAGKGNVSASPIVKKARPAYRVNPPPEYPGLARKRGYQGTVTLDVLVGQKGKVKDIKMFRSSGYSILDEKAVSSVKNWLFEPGMKGDERVEMWVRIPILFKLE